MERTPKDKVQFCNDLLKTEVWSLICEELDAELGYINNDISSALRKKNFEKASRLDGKKEMVEFLKQLPLKIRKQNESLIQRIKDLLPNGR